MPYVINESLALVFAKALAQLEQKSGKFEARKSVRFTKTRDQGLNLTSHEEPQYNFASERLRGNELPAWGRLGHLLKEIFQRVDST
jgi:hypothetical protein